MLSRSLFLFEHIDARNEKKVILWHRLDYFSGLALVFPCKHYYIVGLFDFHCIGVI